MTPRGTALAAFLFAVASSASAPAAEVVIVVQRSPLAGFRHYHGAEVLRDLRPGERLELVREPENPHDPNAVRVEWRGVTLGYVPRRENSAVARQMDRGTALEARLGSLRQNRNRSVRIELEVVAPLPDAGAATGNRPAPSSLP
ncbi:MAG TPA: HIRAN domain-containing protein [Burkholderiales bacterium]|jgi:hypothetical protein